MHKKNMYSKPRHALSPARESEGKTSPRWNEAGQTSLRPSLGS